MTTKIPNIEHKNFMGDQQYEKLRTELFWTKRLVIEKAHKNCSVLT
jgi:hypothetical protein